MRIRAFCSALAFYAASAGVCLAAPPKVREVVVANSRVHVGDLVPGLAPDAAAIDLGPAPAVGGSRVVDREEILVALRGRDMAEPPGLSASIRVVRKVKRLEVAEIDQFVRDGLSMKMPHGVTLDGVHPSGSVNVPDGWTRMTAEIPRPPHRVGPVHCDASVTFFEDTQALSVLSVPVEITVSKDAAVADVQHGARLALVIRRGLVEVTSTGTAGADADIGGIVPVVLRPSGRTILARLEDSTHAVAIESQ